VKQTPGKSNGKKGIIPVFVALLTPLSDEGTTDLPALEEHARHLVSRGIDGFLVCGTTGEGPLLDDDEIIAVTRAVLRASAGRALVMTQIGRPGTQASARLLSRAIDAGADGVMAVTPYYYALEDAQVEGHYEALRGAAGDSPLFAYSIPRRTGNDLHPALVRRLADLGITGIKDSTRSMERHRDYLLISTERAPASFDVYMGSDGFVRQALEGGSTGIVSAIANAQPDLFLDLRRAVLEDQVDEATRLQAEIDVVRDSLPEAGSIAALKTAVADRLAAQGIAYPTAVRAPLGGAF
jgi:dihydrodipicolinate synthase/N-acetylneuraminate lyase